MKSRLSMLIKSKALSEHKCSTRAGVKIYLCNVICLLFSSIVKSQRFQILIESRTMITIIYLYPKKGNSTFVAEEPPLHEKVQLSFDSIHHSSFNDIRRLQAVPDIL